MSRTKGFQNIGSLRRKLRRMEKHVQSDIPQAIEQTMQAIVADAVRNAPEREGDLKRAIEYKIGRDGLTGVAGPGAKAAIVQKTAKGSAFANRSTRMSRVSAHKLLQFFKGYWAEFGTKGNPSKNIPAQPARPFMQPAWDVNSAWARERVRKAINKQLKNVSNL